MKRRLKTLKPYARNLFTAFCAGLMLVSYLALSPWVQIAFPGNLGGNPAGAAPNGVNLPEGFTQPEGFTPPEGFTAPEGFEPPAGFEALQAASPVQSPATTGGFTPPSAAQLPPGIGGGRLGAPGTAGLFLVPLAAGAALALTLWSVWKPRFSRAASAFTLVCGLIALVYYAIFFVMDAMLPLPINFVDLARPGFWLALVGSVGLFAQVFIPRFAVDSSQEAARTLVPQAKRSGLSVSQNLSVAMDALMANKMRSALTMLGIIIGVASVVSMISVGRGATASITEQITSTGLNLLTISPGASGGGPPGRGGGGGGNVETITYDDAQMIAERITGIDAVLPQYSGALDVRSDQERLQTTVLGVTEQYAPIRSINIEIGRYLSEAEYNNDARVAVLGQRAAEELFGGLNPVGRDIRIDGKRFEVVGVLEGQDGGFGEDPNLQIHVPLSTAYRQLFEARKTGSTDNLVTSIVVAVTDLEDINRVMDDLELLLREQHRLDVDEDNDFSILNQQSLLDTAGTITGILTVLLGAIASISLLVGGIGIMNIMLVSVSERTKEIGLRKAIGARRGHISQQFFIETIFLSLLGGTLGVLLGVAIALLVNASGVLNAVVSLDSVGLGLGFSALVGIFFGVYPANRAAALEPIEALRYE